MKECETECVTVPAASCPCREVYEEGAALLAGMEDASLDARLLLEHFCGISTHRLLADPDLPVSAPEREAFLEGIRRRAAREPLAYILGEQIFMGLPFMVSPDVLIPEQDTENLVEEALRYLEDDSRILDLCTGSGCILLSLLRYSNGCTGTGTDISAPALRLAGENARALGLSGRCRWFQGDLFAALDPGVRFDLIISNPPYVPTVVIETLEPEVREAQPRLALDGGPDGLAFYRRIIREASGFLMIGGRLMLEIGHDQAEAVRTLLEEAGYYGIEIIRDYGGNDRVVTAVRSMKQRM
ncbi:MAG: peptide chain release factor N(5)-glutamine methyltransferase [Eubacteriales bacterium]|nr:peptide chain release factor N(5)-glutamine methyltransferase [Eubacteriales bacterium]